MDKGKDWKWLPAHMPGVARLIAEKRRTLGDAHVNTCWRRGVVGMEPGWFYAREGPLAVGVPWDDPQLAAAAELQVSRTQAVLVVRMPGAAHGA
jgi:hypothetical protein